MAWNASKKPDDGICHDSRVDPVPPLEKSNTLAVISKPLALAIFAGSGFAADGEREVPAITDVNL